MKVFVMLCIHGYRAIISPFKPCSCRFVPTCSEYALDALRIHGLMKGSILILRRLLRCHPWCASGYDPVPSRTQHPSSLTAVTTVPQEHP